MKYASPEYLESLPISYGTRQTTCGVRGVAPEYGLMRSEVPAAGRFINAEDVDKRRRVVFLGDDVARKLFSNEPPVGRTVRISGLPFEVVGVLAKKAQLSSYFYPDSMSAFVPYTTIRQLFVQDFIDYMVFQSVEPSRQEVAVRQVRELLAVRHRFDPRDERAVRFDLAEEIIDIVDAMAAGLMIVLVFIGALTLHDRRRRRDEHHAGVGAGAHAGDRRAQGRRSAAPGHPQAVPARGARHHVHRRAGRDSAVVRRRQGRPDPALPGRPAGRHARARPTST